MLVKGDDTTGNMNWYGVIKRMISLEFPGQKEVILFQCNWFDVPAATTNRGIGYNKCMLFFFGQLMTSQLMLCFLVGARKESLHVHTATKILSIYG